MPRKKFQERRESLFDFIKSLTPSEKTRIKTFSEVYSKDSNQDWVKLTDMLYSYTQPKYKESEVKHYFPKVKNFSRLKRYTFERIIKALAYIDFCAEESIYGALGSAEASIKRGGYFQAQPFIEKAKQLAWEVEKFDLVLTSLKLETIVIEKIWNIDDKPQALFAISEEKEKATRLLINLSEYDLINSRLFIPSKAIYDKSGLPGEQFEELRNSNIIIKDQTLSNRAKLNYLLCKAYLATLSGEFDTSVTINASLLELYQDHPWLIKDNPNAYYDGLTFGVAGAVQSDQIELAKSYLIILEEEFNKPGNKKYLFLPLVKAYLAFADSTNSVAEGKKATTLIQNHLKGLKKDFFPREIQLILFAAALFEYSHDKEIAKTLISKLVKIKARVPFEAIGRLIDVCIQIEELNFDGIEKRTRNYAPFFNHLESEYQSLQLIFKFLKKSFDWVDKGIFKSKKAELLDTLENQIKTNPQFVYFNQLFDFITWIKGYQP